MSRGNGYERVRNQRRIRRDPGETQVPHGAATMTDDEFWGRVRERSKLAAETAMFRGTGQRSGR